VVAIDGPAGAGKSTVSRAVAKVLRVPHLDTGALYRAVTLAALRAGVTIDDAEACGEIARTAVLEQRGGRTFLDDEDVEDAIRGEDVTAAVSTVAAHASVRDALVPLQRDLARNGAVVEGRDIGSVVLPDADLKVFLTATPEERARRRAHEVGAVDAGRRLAERDARDAGRPIAPLTVAPGAWEFDTTGTSLDEVVGRVAARARDAWQSATSGAAGDADTLADAAVAQLSSQRDDEAGPQSAVVTARRGLPRVAVVGRPNVGKSTLVNRFLRRRIAIVEPRPGVTRDRTEHVVPGPGTPFVIVDTGGWEHDAEGLNAQVARQAERAIAGADVVLLVVDTTVGPLDDDERYARMLRRAGRPSLLVANKVDSPKQEADAHAFHVLGLGEPHAVSAAHGDGVAELLEAVVRRLPDTDAENAPDETGVPRVAIVGRPNVGKSSLFNRLVGEERSLVDPVPHTTRDAVDTMLEFDGEPWVFVDTAGLRHRYRSGEETEKFSVDRTRAAIEESDLVLFVVDASEPIAEQDQRLAALVRDAGTGVVLVLNKWDLVDEDRRPYLEKELDRLLSFAAFAPRVNVSARTARGVHRIVPNLRVVWAAYQRRVPTRELNLWLEGVTANAAPPSTGRGTVRIKYVTQAEAAPPKFLVFASGRVQPQYLRYLERELRDSYDFTGVPLAVETRSSRATA